MLFQGVTYGIMKMRPQKLILNLGDKMKLTVGNNIRSLRRKMNMTQEELADKLCVSLQVVSRWETGATYPPLDVIPALSTLFGVTIDELIGIPKAEDDNAPIEVNKELISARNSGDKERLMEQLRIAHRDYPRDWRIFSWLCYETSDQKEKRKLAVDLLENCNDPYYRNGVLGDIATTEKDDEVLNDFLDRYMTTGNTSKFHMLCNRFLYREEYSNYEQLKQWLVYSSLTGDVLPYLRPNCPPVWDIEESLKSAEMRLGIINLLAEVTNQDVVVGDGKPDLWFPERWKTGIRYCCYLSGIGKANEALRVLESLTDLAESFLNLPDGTELSFRTFSLSALKGTKITDYTSFPGDVVKQRRYRFRLLPEKIDACEESFISFVPSYDLYPLTAENGWEWFDPIRNTDRFKSCLERLKKWEKTIPLDSEESSL